MQTLLLSRPFHNPDFVFQTDCENICERISNFYGEHLSFVKDGLPNDGIEISIEKINGSTYLFSCSQDKKAIETSSPLQEISRIAFEKTTFDDAVFALHAAAVEYKGKAHIFIASTTSGKTTLTAYLTAVGMGYMTDDCVMLDRENLKVYPYAAPLHLRDGGIEVLKKYGVNLADICLVEDSSLKRYTYIPQNRVDTPLEVAGIYFIERSESVNSIADIPTSQAIERLMISPITPYKISGEYIRLLSKISKIGCKKLVYSDMNFVKQVVEGQNRDE